MIIQTYITDGAAIPARNKYLLEYILDDFVQKERLGDIEKHSKYPAIPAGVLKGKSKTTTEPAAGGLCGSFSLKVYEQN